jgi:hypothetical protein
MAEAARSGNTPAVDLPKLHVGEQDARALLAPLRADLAALERRTARHLTRLKLRPEDQERLTIALQTVRQASAAIETLWASAERELG